MKLLMKVKEWKSSCSTSLTLVDVTPNASLRIEKMLWTRLLLEQSKDSLRTRLGGCSLQNDSEISHQSSSIWKRRFLSFREYILETWNNPKPSCCLDFYWMLKISLSWLKSKLSKRLRRQDSLLQSLTSVACLTLTLNLKLYHVTGSSEICISCSKTTHSKNS